MTKIILFNILAMALIVMLVSASIAPAYAFQTSYKNGKQAPLTDEQVQQILDWVLQHHQITSTYDGTVLTTSLDNAAKSAILTLDSSSCTVCMLQVHIPRMMLTSQNCTTSSCSAAPFLVFVDGVDVPYTYTVDTEMILLSIHTTAGSEKVVITGDNIPLMEQMSAITPRKGTTSADVVLREKAAGELLFCVVAALANAHLVDGTITTTRGDGSFSGSPSDQIDFTWGSVMMFHGTPSISSKMVLDIGLSFTQ